MAPKISVLMPTYNYARYLPQAIESVLAQSEPDFELIISDDASVDHSSEVIRAYAARDARIQWVTQRQNLGMVPNWNACLALARGQYVQFLFGDDCFAQCSALQQLSGLLDRYPSTTLATAPRLVIDHTNSVREIWTGYSPPGWHAGAEVTARCLRERKNLIGEPSAVMFRRHCAQRGFDPALRQIVDLEMWFHLLQQGDFVQESHPLCAFRVHGAQQTEVNRNAGIGPLETLLITARHLPRLSRRVLPRFHRARIVFRTVYYSRKRNRRSPAIISAERSLAALVPRSLRALCWMEHRLVRPFHNLRRHFTERSPERVPNHLRNWRPLRWDAAASVAPQHAASS